jgi:hypothetical protein
MNVNTTATIQKNADTGTMMISKQPEHAALAEVEKTAQETPEDLLVPLYSKQSNNATTLAHSMELTIQVMMAAHGMSTLTKWANAAGMMMMISLLLNSAGFAEVDPQKEHAKIGTQT